MEKKGNISPSVTPPHASGDIPGTPLWGSSSFIWDYSSLLGGRCWIRVIPHPPWWQAVAASCLTNAYGGSSFLCRSTPSIQHPEFKLSEWVLFPASFLAGNPEYILDHVRNLDLGWDCLHRLLFWVGWTPPTCDHNLQGVTASGKHSKRPGESRTCVGPGMFSGHWAKREVVEMISMELTQTCPICFEQSESLKWRMEVTLKSHSLS